MPIEILVPIGLFVLGIVVSHTLSGYGVRILEQQKNR
jgi:hypothetical protein